MIRERPTLAAIRSRAQKQHAREIGNWLACWVGRPLAVYGTWLAIRLGLSAHQVTALALGVSLAGACAIATGDPAGLMTGVGLLYLAFWLDHVDGQVARWLGTASLDGVYFDYLMHHTAQAALGFASGFALAVRQGRIEWTVAGCAAAGGWTLLALHNDCRYKAFFQRLKSTSLHFRVQGGSGGRPAPPARWPRHGLSCLSWPLYKLCEPHIILLELTLIAALSALVPAAGLIAFMVFVFGHAILAPVLALLRIGRTIVRGGVEEEFARWFQAGPGRAGEPHGDSRLWRDSGHAIPGTTQFP